MTTTYQSVRSSSRSRRPFLRAALALLLTTSSLGSMALANPSTIRYVVPYPPGGAADQITRLVASEVSTILKTPIVIENKAGAAGMIAAQTVLHAAPDGSIFYVGANAPMVINQAIYSSMPYDPAKDFIPVAGMGKSPLLLVTRKDLGAQDLPALIELGKQKQGQLTMGSASSGNITHLAGEEASSKMGFKVTHIPFSGSAPAIVNMMGGHVDIMFDALPSCMQQAKAGSIVPLAILDSERFPQLPEVATAQELGFPNLEAAAWFGVMARTGTPAPIVESMNQAINQALQNPALIDKLRSIGAQPMPGTQQEFAQFIDAERQQWIPLAQALGVKAD